MTVADRISAQAQFLSAAEQRIAEVVLTRPQLIAFGTVAAVAKATSTSGASVVRLANKLGFDGFVDMQAEVQGEMSAQLGAAASRIQDEGQGDDLLGEVLRVEAANIEATLRGANRTDFRAVVELISDLSRGVWVASGDCVRGVAATLTEQLFSLRSGVAHIEGNQLQVGRALAAVQKDDVVLVMDFARYDRTVLQIAELADNYSAHVVALTDSPLSPLAQHAATTLVVSRLGVGPFDSAVAMTVMCQALVAATAQATRGAASKRLERAESAWRVLAALTERS